MRCHDSCKPIRCAACWVRQHQRYRTLRPIKLGKSDGWECCSYSQHGAVSEKTPTICHTHFSDLQLDSYFPETSTTASTSTSMSGCISLDTSTKVAAGSPI